MFIARLGAVELTGNHRFSDERQREAVERLRAADSNEVQAAVEQYDQLGLLRQFDRVSQVHQAMVNDWLDLTEEGHTVKMVADSNRVVDDLNVLARKALVDRGRVARRGQAYSDRQTGRRIVLAEGDRVRLGRNDARLAQPGGNTAVVRNGMEATVTRTTRRGLEITLDAEHVSQHGPASLLLPARYVAADVDYGYAVTCDKAQGVTVDHVLYHPTDRSSSERAYVALSRGRHSNRIYAVAGVAWQEALSGSRAHTIAGVQQPSRVDQVDRAERGVRCPHQGRELARQVPSERELKPDLDCAVRRGEPGRSIAM